MRSGMNEEEAIGRDQSGMCGSDGGGLFQKREM